MNCRRVEEGEGGFANPSNPTKGPQCWASGNPSKPPPPLPFKATSSPSKPPLFPLRSSPLPFQAPPFEALDLDALRWTAGAPCAGKPELDNPECRFLSPPATNVVLSFLSGGLLVVLWGSRPWTTQSARLGFLVSGPWPMEPRQHRILKHR